MLPRKKVGGVCSRTLKGKNDKSQQNQVAAIIPQVDALPTAMQPVFSVSQLQQKVRADAKIKEDLRKHIIDDSVTITQLKERIKVHLEIGLCTF